jgi:predicted DNA-binding transcriptional regulator AlpA
MGAQQTTPEDGGLRVRAASAFLGLSPGTLYRLSSQGVVPCVRLGRALVFRRRDLCAILERGIPGRRTDVMPATAER